MGNITRTRDEDYPDEDNWAHFYKNNLDKD
jgi:hypothetical protein